MNKNIKETLNKFLDNIEDNHPHRYRSWEVCHNEFLKHAKKDLTNEDINLLALHLTCYLASWGMYRGSSFLLKEYDYTIHAEAVKIAMEYTDLFYINPFKETEKYLNLLFGENGVYIRLKSYYEKLKKQATDSNSLISTTLVTKILMGIFGCVPAYDRFFITGISMFKISLTKQKRPHIEELLKYISSTPEMYNAFYEILNELNNKNRNYTIMKIIDMYFWQLGKDKKIS